MLDIAQSLYEKHNKVTSYLLSDCQYIPKSQTDDIEPIFNHLCQQKDLKQWVDSTDSSRRSRVWNDEKITAHHAICRYYLAQFYPIYEYDQTTIFLNIAGEHSKATGKTSDSNTEQALPKMSKDDKVPVDVEIQNFVITLERLPLETLKHLPNHYLKKLNPSVSHP